MRRTLADLVLCAAIAMAFQPASADSSWSADEAHYRGQLDVDPDNAEAWLGLARVQSWQNSLDASARSYSRYRELEPEDATALRSPSTHASSPIAATTRERSM